MIKLAPIVKEILKEGGNLFGTRASRVTTGEMNAVYNELHKKLGRFFSKMTLSKALKSKRDHGDVDIVVEPNTKTNMDTGIKTILGNNVKDYSKNGNIHSILYHSDFVNKNIHIDFIVASEEDYDAQFDYLSYNDFSGILGVMARRLGYSYSSEGFFKVFVDKSGRHHKILISKNLRDGLKILGYGSVLSTFEDISSPDDIVKFIESSPFFDSDDYVGQTMNHSDRKRIRAGRPTADYIRKSLIELNKHRQTEEFDYFFKKLYPSKYTEVLKKQEEIESVVIPKSKYGGEWVLKNFPEIKPGPVIGQIKKFWHDTYGDKLDGVSEQELLAKTREFLKI